jgi:predicted transcriptional regulator
MSERFPVDYDAEAVYVDGAWMSRDDLAGRIRALLDKGEYRISRLSAALEQLEVEMAQARVLAVRVPPALADALDAEAANRGCASSALLREALVQFLQGQPARNGVASHGVQEEVDGRWFEG